LNQLLLATCCIFLRNSCRLAVPSCAIAAIVVSQFLVQESWIASQLMEELLNLATVCQPTCDVTHFRQTVVSTTDQLRVPFQDNTYIPLDTYSVQGRQASAAQDEEQQKVGAVVPHGLHGAAAAAVAAAATSISTGPGP
jgi:hypothetical protein